MYEEQFDLSKVIHAGDYEAEESGAAIPQPTPDHPDEEADPLKAAVSPGVKVKQTKKRKPREGEIPPPVASTDPPLNKKNLKSQPVTKE